MLQKLPECQIPELRNSQCQDQPLTSQHRFPLCAQLFLCLLASEQGSSKGLHIICELWVKTVKPNETQWFCHGSEALFYHRNVLSASAAANPCCSSWLGGS